MNLGITYAVEPNFDHFYISVNQIMSLVDKIYIGVY